MIESKELIRCLEQYAFNTWPAAVQWRYGNWTVRHSGPYTRRANSVFAVGGMPQSGEWLREIEQFYNRRGATSQFHLSPASPEGLDELLQRHGYVKHTVTSVMIADTETVIEQSGGPAQPQYEAVLQERPDSRWLTDFLEAEQFNEARRTFYEGLHERIAPICTYLSICNKEGRTVGVGTAVAERGWAGFTNVATHPDFRRRGVGSLLVHHLASWAAEHGAKRLYLQVMADNEAAVALYRKSGYSHFYDYHYRSKE